GAGIVEQLDVPLRAGADDDLGPAVQVGVGRRHADAARPAGEREETERFGAGAAVEDLYVPARRPGIGADDHVVEAVAIDVAGGDVDAALVAREGEEAVRQAAIAAVEDPDVPARRTRAGPGDQVRHAVARHVTDGHAHPAEIARERLHAQLHLAGEAVQQPRI